MSYYFPVSTTVRPLILAVRALLGCDTVSYPFGKGKISALNLLLKLDLNLQVFTEPDAEEVDWMKAGIDFLSCLLYTSPSPRD